MKSLREVEEAVRRLPGEELAAFRAWFAQYDAEAWDREIEEDVRAGRLGACPRKKTRPEA